jgi:hypothetical protein
MGGSFGERKYTSGTPSFSELSTAREKEEKDNAEAQRARRFAENFGVKYRIGVVIGDWNRRETKRRDTENAEQKSERQDGHGVPCPYGSRRNLWREAEGFVFGVDPDGDDSGFLGFFGVVVGDGHGIERADGYADFDAGAGAVGRFGFEDAVAFYGAVVAGGAPVGDEVLELVAGAGAWFPKLVGGVHISGYDGVEKLLGGFFLGIKTKPEPYGDDGDDESRRHGENHGP